MDAIIQQNILVKDCDVDEVVETAQSIERETGEQMVLLAERSGLTEEELESFYKVLGVQIVWIND